MLAAALAATAAAQPAGKVPQLVFPVVGAVQYRDDFGEPRPQGPHEGNDLMAKKRSVAVATETGKIKFWTTSASAGCMLYLYGQSGTTYLYIHLNNDLTSGNDNRGKCIPGVSYWPGLQDGAKVQAGQPIGFVGDSGDANGVGSHLHFEVHPNGGAAVDPYPYLQKAQHLLFSAPAGSTVTLALTGHVLGALAGQLALNVEKLKVLPSGDTITHLNVPVTLTVPADSLAASAESLTGQQVVVLTSPFQTGLDALLGKGLSAAQVALLVGP